MNTTDCPRPSFRRARRWWLGFAMVPLAIFVAMVGYDQLWSQDRPRPIHALAPATAPASPQFQPLRPQPSVAPQGADGPIYQPYASPPTGPGYYPNPLQPNPTPIDPAQALANQLHRLSPQSIDYARALTELEETVAKQFEDRHRQQQQQVTAAQQRLAQLTEELEKRAAVKDQIVARRINQLLGERDPLDWDSAPAFSPGGSLPTTGPRLARPPSTLTAPSPTPVASPPSPVSVANDVVNDLARLTQEIQFKQTELARVEALESHDAVPAAEAIRIRSELAMAQQQQALVQLQLEQFEKQSELQLEHARQALDDAEKRLQVAREPLDDSNPSSYRQQQRDIAEAETMRLQARQLLAWAELQMDHLKRLRKSVGEVEEMEAADADEPEEVEVAE